MMKIMVWRISDSAFLMIRHLLFAELLFPEIAKLLLLDESIPTTKLALPSFIGLKKEGELRDFANCLISMEQSAE